MKRLIIGLQKSGRLREGSLELLKACGLKVDYREGQLKVITEEFPAELLFLRNSDIPEYVADGIVDVGIVGSNILEEEEKECAVVLPLGFSRCRLSVAVPEYSGIQNSSDLEGLRIATSYPVTVRKFLKKAGINADIHTISGSVEIAPSLKLSEAIVDIISTGNTLFQNGLREVETVLESQAVLIRGRFPDPEKEMLLGQLVFRMRSVMAAKSNKYILLNAPDEKLDQICRLLPGIKSPTVLPLALSGWSSIHSVVKQENVWGTVKELKSAGAQGILVIPIEKMIE